jgi:cobalt/nickel transport system permease protein
LHIPDGYLSPATCGVFGAVMVPVWYRAAAKLKKFDIARIPLLAMGAVFSFLIMMFNLPIPDGTTAHATGAALLAILLGPWTAVIAISVTLFIQAVVFGDGGILVLGANSFNMAFIAPFVGYYTYSLLGKGARAGSKRQLAASAFSGYLAINAAAFMAALEFGSQPLFFTAADGSPLYCPYGFYVAIPAMMAAHLSVAGVVEGLVTLVALKCITLSSVLPQKDKEGSEHV